NGREFARGGVYVTQAGEPKYRSLVYVTGPAPPPSDDLTKLFDMSDILYYELEAYSGGEVVSAYRSSTNIRVDPVTFEPGNVPQGAQVARGVPGRARERARHAHGVQGDGGHNNRLQGTAGGLGGN